MNNSPLISVALMKTSCDVIAGGLIGIKPDSTITYSVANSVGQVAGTALSAIVIMPVALYTVLPMTGAGPIAPVIKACIRAALPMLIVGWTAGIACGHIATKRAENPLTMREVVQLSVASTLLFGASLAAISLLHAQH